MLFVFVYSFTFIVWHCCRLSLLHLGLRLSIVYFVWSSLTVGLELVYSTSCVALTGLLLWYFGCLCFSCLDFLFEGRIVCCLVGFVLPTLSLGFVVVLLFMIYIILLALVLIVVVFIYFGYY